jgi:hypothetical protein
VILKDALGLDEFAFFRMAAFPPTCECSTEYSPRTAS